MFQPPEISAFKDFFDGGEFSYGEQPPAVRDKDIARAQSEALIVFNPNLFPDQTEANIAFNYLTAHFLFLNMKAAMGAGGSASFAIASRSADGMSVSYAIPQAIVNDPFLSQFATTSFGTKYAAMVLPAAAANSRGVVAGRTTA